MTLFFDKLTKEQSKKFLANISASKVLEFTYTFKGNVTFKDSDIYVPHSSPEGEYFRNFIDELDVTVEYTSLTNGDSLYIIKKKNRKLFLKLLKYTLKSYQIIQKINS